MFVLFFFSPFENIENKKKKEKNSHEMHFTYRVCVHKEKERNELSSMVERSNKIFELLMILLLLLSSMLHKRERVRKRRRREKSH
jgi:hypothetical protein